MTFDEFFKKKRIDTAALQKADPALFSEFKVHYEQMGEKSFDHTKKYWFNKTRRQYPLAVEVKTEKAHIANPIAEQTITESLTGHPTPAPAKIGFTPKFRAGVTAKPVEPIPETLPVEQPIVQSEESTAPKPAGFVPRFKAKPKVEEEDITPPAPVAEIPAPSQETAPKPAGFVPRFKAKPKAEEEDITPPALAPETPAPSSETAPKPAYKPRFVPPKKTEE